jgi:hypothetical protein
MSDTTVAGTIEHLDPHTLTIEANVRPNAPITPAFVQSIKENGVLTPVLGHRADDGMRRSPLVSASARHTNAAKRSCAAHASKRASFASTACTRLSSSVGRYRLGPCWLTVEVKLT